MRFYFAFCGILSVIEIFQQLQKGTRGNTLVQKRSILVLIASAVSLTAKLAVRRGQIVVNPMMYGLQSF